MAREILEGQVLNAQDVAYLNARGQLDRALELGCTIKPGVSKDNADFSAVPDEDEEDLEYSDYKVPQLQAEIKRRNATREDEDTFIEPKSARKDDLVEALEADDEAYPESEDEE